MFIKQLNSSLILLSKIFNIFILKVYFFIHLMYSQITKLIQTTLIIEVSKLILPENNTEILEKKCITIIQIK